MKNNRGVTLTSLAIYIIGLVTMIGLLSVFMRFFYGNVNRKSYTDDTAERYSKFIMYLTNDVNSNDIKKVYVDNSERIHIKFNNESYHEYLYQNEGIYYREVDVDGHETKQILLCENITSCQFKYENNEINVTSKVNSKDYNNIFTIKNSNF